MLVISAMRHFAQELRVAEGRVTYNPLEDRLPSPKTLLRLAIARHAPAQITITEPGDWHLI